MLHKVAHDDEISFRNNKDWLYNSPAQALIFADLGKVWPQMRSTYNGTFKNLVFGELPDENSVLITLKRIKERLSLIQWTVTKVD